MAPVSHGDEYAKSCRALVILVAPFDLSTLSRYTDVEDVDVTL